jgi:hypothetical protein
VTAPTIPDAAPAPTDADSLLNAPPDVFAKAFGLDSLLGTAPADDAGEPAASPEDSGAGEAPAAAESPASEGEPSATAAAAAAAAEPSEGDATTAEADQKATAKGAPLTKFTALQGGVEVEVPEDLTFTFNAGGKTHENVTVDRLVRMAQSAGNNETLREQAMQAEAAKMSAEEQVAQVQQEYQQHVEEVDAIIARLLTDDDYRARARDQFARANSAEVRAERAETELARTRDSQKQNEAAASARSFVTEQLAPAMETLLSRHSTVTPDELWGRFTLLTNHLMVNGAIPPRRIPDVAKVFREKLVPWMAETHEHRTVTAAQQKADADAAVRKAQTTATLAKRQAARLTRPATAGAVVTPGVSATPAPKEPVIESADDAVAAVVQSVRQGAALQHRG